MTSAIEHTVVNQAWSIRQGNALERLREMPDESEPELQARREGAVKSLTLHQPWASLIAHGVKSIETRSWAQLAEPEEE